MKTADYPVWLAILPDQRAAARADAGAHPDGRSAIEWNKEAQLWFARPGADLSRLQSWLPDRSIRSSGGGDPQSEFLDALTSAGLILDDLPIMDGKSHRVPVVEGSNGNRDGVYKGFLNGIKPGGWFINYHRADNDKDITKWKASGSLGQVDQAARVHIRAVMRQSQDDAARKQAALYATQTAKANRLISRMPAADPEHGYLVRKGISVAEDVRQTSNGALAIPLYNVDGEFRTLQYIPPEGQKVLFTDAPKSGSFRVEGGPLANGRPVLYAEGYATARSLHMVTGLPVVMTVDAGNMQTVGEILKARFPDSPHLFMADIDHKREKNKGLLSAQRAAEATGGAVVEPDLRPHEIESGLTDFNDLHQSRGSDALRADLLPRINEALISLNYKDPVMAKPDDAQTAPENAPPSQNLQKVATRRPGVAKERTEEIVKLRDEGMKPAQIAEQLGIGQTSVYRILNALKAKVAEIEPSIPEMPSNGPTTSVEPTAVPAPEQATAAQQTVAPQAQDKADAVPEPAAVQPVVNVPQPEPQAVATETVSAPASSVAVDEPKPAAVQPAVNVPQPEPQAVATEAVAATSSTVAVDGPEPAAVQPADNVPQPEPQAVATEMAAAPTSTVASALPPPSGSYDGYAGLYGTRAELQDRLAALTTGETSPAALLKDFNTLRVRVDSAAIASVYTREHMKEMQQVFSRLTQGGMAGADVMDKGAVSRLRSLIGQRDTWNSLHPTSGSLDVNTIPTKVSQQYALLAKGDISRAQFDREVRMLYGEFTRAEPERFAGSRHADTQAVFERMAALQSPDRAAQFTAATTVSMTQLPPASAEDLNSAALYRLQNELRDGFLSLARGESSAPLLSENVARLQAKLDEAKAQGVYAERHLNEIQGAFDRVTQNGLAGMPAADAPAPRGDFASRYSSSASLDVATVPARVEAQYAMLVRGDVSRAQFDENLIILRNEVVRQAENGKVNPEALAAADVLFANLSSFSATASGAIPQPAVAEVPASAPVIAAPVNSNELTAQKPDVLATTPQPAPTATEVLPAVKHAEPVTQPAMSAETAPVTASLVTADASPKVTRDPAPAEPTVQPAISAEAEKSVPAAEVVATEPGAAAVQAEAGRDAASPGLAAPVTEEHSEESKTPEAEFRADLGSGAATSATPVTAAFGEENAILVGARRVAPQPEDTPAANAPRADQDKLLSRVSHEDHPDGKSVIYRLDSQPAFIDRGNRLVMAEGASAHEEKVLAALLTAAKFYHGKIELTGSDEFKAFAINVIVNNGLQVSMKNPSQQVALDEAKRAAGQPVGAPDAVRGDPVAPAAAPAPTAASTAPPVAPAAAAPAMADAPASADMTPAPVSPVPEKSRQSDIRPDIHTPAEKAREPVTGKVTACGQAPFRFETDGQLSTFITLRTREGSQTYWGKELAGLIRETRLREGQMVTLQWMGQQPVTVNVPVKDTQGNFTGHYEEIQTKRNQWALTSARGSRVQTGGDEMIKLSAFSANRYTQVQHALVSQLGINIDAPPKPVDGLYWLRPDGQGSASAGDALSAQRPEHNENAGKPVMTSWGEDGKPDLYLVQGDGHYLQGIVRQNDVYQHVLVSLPDSKEAPRMVINLLTPDGAQPIGSGNGINRSDGKPVPREHVVFRVTGDEKQRIAKLHDPATIPPALHARLGYDERYKVETVYPKEQPAAAPQAAPVTPPRPAQ
ncbi:helix-turn-helix domain-containing protein [Enterobacter hormaechei]|nr:helix-turn-helix domain-containing protein [Enterobacter hormaechei]ELD3190773.1 helix-turn-helix domain-containing protein [Enterobacter hormaechei]